MARVRRWKSDIQDDVGAMAKWVTTKEEEDRCSVQQLGDCPSKGEVAKRLTATLGRLWGEAANPDLAGLVVAVEGDRPAHGLRPVLDGRQLRRRALRAKLKAGGLDGWSGALFARLPQAFFDRLAQVWHLVLAGRGFPESWRQIRVVAIPKPDGGSRPLALTDGVEGGGFGVVVTAAVVVQWLDASRTMRRAAGKVR